MKAQMQDWTSLKQRVLTKKPTTESKLFSMEAEAEWQGMLKNAPEQIKGEGPNF